MVGTQEWGVGIWEAPIRIPFQERGFSDRTINALIDCQIDLPERLLFMSKKQLKLLRGIGETSMAEIVAYRDRFLGACLGNRRILLAKEARVRFCPWG